MRAGPVPAGHPLRGTLECRHRHDQAVQVQRPTFLSPVYHAHSVRICACRLLGDEAAEHGCEADMELPGYSIGDLCGMDCSEVLRRAGSRLAESSLGMLCSKGWRRLVKWDLSGLRVTFKSHGGCRRGP